MINENFIINNTGIASYLKGMNVYRNRKVVDVRKETDSNTGIVVLYGVVESSRGDEFYYVTVTLSENEDWMIASDCDCPAYLTYEEPCKHIAAVLIYYMKHGASEELLYLDTNTGERVSTPAIAFRTSSSMTSLLDRMDRKETSMKNVELTPYFHFSGRDYLEVEFRINAPGKREYVIKNITSLVRLINNNEYCTYGKDLKFTHTRNAFSKESRKLVDFLGDIVNGKDAYIMRSGYYYGYQSNTPERYLFLRGRYLEEFMDICKSIGFYEVSGANYDRNRPYTMIDASMNNEIRIEGNEDGITLQASIMPYYVGSEHIFLVDIDKRIIRRCMSDEKLIDILDYLRNNRETSIRIANEDLPRFTKHIYPTLSLGGKLSITDYDPEDHMPADASFEFYLDLPQDNMITIEAYAVYPKEKYNLAIRPTPKENRNIEQEKNIEEIIRPWSNAFNNEKNLWCMIDDDDLMYRFLKEGMNEFQNYGEVFISDKLKKLRATQTAKFSFGISVSENLLQLEFVPETLDTKQLAEILSRYDRKKRYYRLKSGEFIDLDASMDELAEFADDLAIDLKELAEGTVTVPKFRARYLDQMMDDSELRYTKDQSFTSLIENMKTVKKHDLPKGLNATLRPYQKKGFDWLNALKDNGFSGLLADEMGLGKTLQVIAFLGGREDRKRTLIVCPASVVYNWADEIRRFMPSLDTKMISGPANIRHELIRTSTDRDILITSYDLLRNDIEVYEEMPFYCEIIDEAQYIKNADTHIARAVKKVNADFRIALTGTPIENRLSELWSIFDYLMPGFFKGYKRFRDHYEIPIVRNQDTGIEKRLRQMISPFILRRLKKDVLKDLPDKLEEVYYAKMEGEQKELYDARVQRLKFMLETQSEKEFSENKIQVLAELTALRQICCDPSLIYNNYKGNSEKINLCIDMLERAIESGHKVLLFSQFTSMFELLIPRLEKQGIRYHLLQGSTPKKNRAEMVTSFAHDDVPVFLISLKAGGTGLNLTAADIVIHYDPWWNTAVENQASDRAHRIGQKNIVTVYKLIMKDTIEERIIKLQEEKNDLADRILSGKELSSSTLSKEALLHLLG